MPLAGVCIQADAYPLFPPLEPGGNFWDTTFLRAALRAIERRKLDALLERLILSVYGWTFQRPLNWGEGGPERWPEARPYFTPPHSQDQRGFCTFDWYSAISEAVLQKKSPMILLQAGLPAAPETIPAESTKLPELDENFIEILNLISISGTSQTTEGSKRLILPEEIISVNFWLLSADQSTHDSPFIWFKETQPARKAASHLCFVKNIQTKRSSLPGILDEESLRKAIRPLQHYLYLGENGEANLASVLQKHSSFILQHHPTIGFSIDEARLANRITLAVAAEKVPEDLLNTLQKQGCQIDWLE